MKLIDLENHFFDQSAIDAFERSSTPPCYRKETGMFTFAEGMSAPFGPMLGKILDVAEGRIADMDRAGISTAVISSTHGVEDLDVAESIAVCRKTNDALYALTQKYPGRYLGSAILPVKDVQAANDELKRCVNELGFVAWHTHSIYNNNTSPDDPRYFPLFKTAVDLGVYVYLHPQLPPDSDVHDLGFSVAGPWCFTIHTATTIIRMISLGLFDELPELKVVLGHLGEGLPFLLPRLESLSRAPSPKTKNKHGYTHYFKKNIWVTTSGYKSKEAFACTAGVLGIDRIIFGSDYPYEDVGDMAGFVKENLDLSAEDREKLCFRNAEQLGISV
ncbi:MAG: amidohydrolase family protein [Oscillospiraceae bacterium]|nr:amidohydrolase family protein [Oscillospiraceae bacterium]